MGTKRRARRGIDAGRGHQDAVSDKIRYHLGVRVGYRRLQIVAMFQNEERGERPSVPGMFAAASSVENPVIAVYGYGAVFGSEKVERFDSLRHVSEERRPIRPVSGHGRPKRRSRWQEDVRSGYRTFGIRISSRFRFPEFKCGVSGAKEVSPFVFKSERRIRFGTCVAYAGEKDVLFDAG